MAPFNHFDFLAPYYDRFIKPTDLTRFCAMAKLPNSGLLLDLGGGTGQKSYPLFELVTGIVIADSSIGMLAQARKKGKLATVNAESERLPFRDETFERVIMVDALHHVRDYRLTASEIWRVAKPYGRIVIVEPDIHTIAVKVMSIIEKLALMRSHFVNRQNIAACFNYPNAKVNIETEASTAWIVVDKQAV